MVTDFLVYLDKLVPSYPKKRFLLAISGGMDSVVLAYLCKIGYLNFALCHVNYHLRGDDSNGDADFVADLASQLDVPMFLLENDLSNYKGNIQLEARVSRYKWFYDLLERKGYDYVFTAHHLNDSTETLLFNLGRGTGLAGLLGIPAENEKIIRPLLCFTKDQVKEYATSNSIAFREDSSNSTDKYARNFLRHHVIPKLEEQNPHFLFGAAKTMSYLQGSNFFAQQAMDHILEEALSHEETRSVLSLVNLLDHPFLQHLLLYWLAPYGFTAKQVEDFTMHRAWNNGAQLLTNDYQMVYDRSRLILSPISHDHTIRISFDPAVISSVEFGRYRFDFSFLEGHDFEKNSNLNTAFFDADKINFISIRYWKDGDAFQPLGMNGKSKSLKKLFVDAKYDLEQKASTPILLSGDKIVWVSGLRGDHRYRVTDKTLRVLRVVMS